MKMQIYIWFVKLKLKDISSHIIWKSNIFIKVKCIRKSQTLHNRPFLDSETECGLCNRSFISELNAILSSGWKAETPEWPVRGWNKKFQQQKKWINLSPKISRTWIIMFEMFNYKVNEDHISNHFAANNKYWSKS